MPTDGIKHTSMPTDSKSFSSPLRAYQSGIFKLRWLRALTALRAWGLEPR